MCLVLPQVRPIAKNLFVRRLHNNTANEQPYEKQETTLNAIKLFTNGHKFSPDGALFLWVELKTLFGQV